MSWKLNCQQKSLPILLFTMFKEQNLMNWFFLKIMIWPPFHFLKLALLKLSAGYFDHLTSLAENGFFANTIIKFRRIQWLAQVEAGLSPREVLRRSIVEFTAMDRQYDPDCPSPLPTDMT